jgi:hypothetical protein
MDIIERETGTIPISIATSLALEGVLGTHPDNPKQPSNPKTIQEIWINLRTMARNLYQAMPSDKAMELDYQAAVDLLVQEATTIKVAMAQGGFTGKIRYYLAAKDAVKWMFPKANLKEAKTPKQLAYEMFERFVSIELYQRLKDEKEVDAFEIEMNPKFGEGIVALLTHYPYELLWKPRFSRLLLLESHTGKLKAYQTWYTKLTGLKDGEFPMPFTEFTLQVFGDNVSIASQPLKYREELKTLSKEKKWSGITTQEKLYHDVMSGSKELSNLYKMLRK